MERDTEKKYLRRKSGLETKTKIVSVLLLF